MIQNITLLYRGSTGWRLSKKHESIMHQEMKRLFDYLEDMRVSYDFLAWRSRPHDPAGAFLHIFVNGVSNKLFSGLRVYHDDLHPELYGRDRRPLNRISPGECVRAVFDRLPSHIDEMIVNHRRRQIR